MRRVAAIDIGSNSVRLAVYGIVGSSLISLFDEKATCALGRDLAGTGRLSPDGRQQAIQELIRAGLPDNPLVVLGDALKAMQSDAPAS